MNFWVSKLRKSILIIIVLLVIMITVSGCITTKSATNTENIITSTNTTTTTTTTLQTHTTTKKPQEEKIIKILSKNDNTVYYIGYDEELADYKWDIKSFTVYDGNKIIIITDIKNLPPKVELRINQYKQYSNKVIYSQLSQKESIIMTQGKILNNKLALTVIDVYKNNKHDGYIVISTQKDKIISLAKPVIDKEYYQKSITNGQCNLNMKYLIKLSNKPLPEGFGMSIDYDAGQSLLINDAFYTTQPDRMSIVFTVKLSIPNTIKTINDSHISITYNYKGYTITTVKVSNYDKIINEILSQCNQSEQFENTGIKIKINDYNVIDYNPQLKVPSNFEKYFGLTHPVSVKINMTVNSMRRTQLLVKMNNEEILIPVMVGENNILLSKTVDTINGSVKFQVINNDRTIKSELLKPTEKKNITIDISENNNTIIVKLNANPISLNNVFKKITVNTRIGSVQLSKILNETKAPQLIIIKTGKKTVITNNLITMLKLTYNSNTTTVIIGKYSGQVHYYSNINENYIRQLFSNDNLFIVSRSEPPLRGSYYGGLIIVPEDGNKIELNPVYKQNIETAQKLDNPSVIYGGIINPVQDSELGLSTDKKVKIGVITYYNIIDYIPLSTDVKPLIITFKELSLSPENSPGIKLPVNISEGISGRVFTVNSEGNTSYNMELVNIDLTDELHLNTDEYESIIKTIRASTNNTILTVDDRNHLILQTMIHPGQKTLIIANYTIPVPYNDAKLVNYTLKVDEVKNSTILTYRQYNSSIDNYYLVITISKNEKPEVIIDNTTIKPIIINSQSGIELVLIPLANNTREVSVMFPHTINYYGKLIVYPVITSSPKLLSLTDSSVSTYIIIGDVYNISS